MLKIGVYEQIIVNSLKAQLDQQSDLLADVAPIDRAEAPAILAKYISEVALHNLELANEKGGLKHQIELANKILGAITVSPENSADEGSLLPGRADQLLGLVEMHNTVFAVNDRAKIIRPETSIAMSSLFTGAVHEPSMFNELKKEIASCDRIDMLVSFIKWSGLRLIIDELIAFTQRGGKLRVITTSYMGATEVKAIESLRELQNTEIKISYDTKRTRLHAKAYVFYRNTSFTTAYIGSSNLSNSAISSGLEWNVKIAAKDSFSTLQKMEATFDSYWNSSEFDYYKEEHKDKLVKALQAERFLNSEGTMQFNFDIKPYPFQEEILDKLEAERKIRGFYRNLIVAATGTGKTVISAFDYKRYCLENKTKPGRLLFIAHREEILKQSLACFRGVLQNANFGELFVGGHRPNNIDHLFMSVQTFNAQSYYEITTAGFYDYIVVDEFHHSAAPSYGKILSHYKPAIILGLTATPERMDGKSILEYFDHRIAAEIRLPEAIDRKLLCPFQYFGISDSVDLSSVTWARGGYNQNALSNIYTGDDIRVKLIIQQLIKYVTEINEVKGLGFCVSVEHAKFMAKAFNQYGIPSIYLTGDSPDNERNSAKKRLVDGEIRFIFTVDIYNEGVDIPDVNTILFLRPTESLTVFLQQLGRGLRLTKDKECLTVLDFIGQANKRYNFEDKFTALLSNTRKGIQKEIKDGFVSLPKGCYIQLEKKAKEYILDNIRGSFDTSIGIVSRIKTFEEDTALKLTLENFCDYYHMELRMIYKSDSFSRLCVKGGVRNDFEEELEDIMGKAFTRICAIDSRRWIYFLLEILPKIASVDISKLSDIQIRMLQMLQFTIWQKSHEECGFKRLSDGLILLSENPVLFEELIEILKYNLNHIDFIDEPVEIGFDCPLDLHCTYTRDQILVATDFMKPSTVREGIKHLPDKKVDLLFVTLNKADKDYSPSTMYNDYSINESLFHWQSQNTTSVESATGKRYINHRALGSKVLLFVREFKAELGSTSAYTYLGLVDYLKHEGSKPINITWRLHKPILAKYLKKTNKLVVG